jgi:methionyl-tRNA synthetase
MLQALNTPDAAWPDDLPAALTVLEAGHVFTVPDNLFGKITDDQRDAWQGRFAGTRA